jgi:hypothetical protein
LCDYDVVLWLWLFGEMIRKVDDFRWIVVGSFGVDELWFY